MGEIPSPTIGNLQPGEIFEFASLTELPAFEDRVAAEVDPDHDPDQWAARRPIDIIIRPSSFRGPITDIRLEVMDSPYPRLLDARERDWQFKGSHGRFALSGPFADQLIPRYRGFSLTAIARPTGRGQRQFHAELWYYPTPLTHGQRNPAYGQDDIRRAIAVPTREVTEFLKLGRF